MTKEGIPQFRTCAVCKQAKVATRVQYDAILDGEDVKVCGVCAREHGLGFNRQLLQEDVTGIRTNFEGEYE